MGNCSILVKTNEIICPFCFNDKSKDNMKQCHFSQLLCNILCSTDSVIDHDNPAVKSIVILRIPKYNVLTYRKNVNQCNKTISLDIFQVEKP